MCQHDQAHQQQQHRRRTSPVERAPPRRRMSRLATLLPSCAFSRLPALLGGRRLAPVRPRDSDHARRVSAVLGLALALCLSHLYKPRDRARSHEPGRRGPIRRAADLTPSAFSITWLADRSQASATHPENPPAPRAAPGRRAPRSPPARGAHRLRRPPPAAAPTAARRSSTPAPRRPRRRERHADRAQPRQTLGAHLRGSPRAIAPARLARPRRRRRLGLNARQRRARRDQRPRPPRARARAGRNRARARRCATAPRSAARRPRRSSARAATAASWPRTSAPAPQPLADRVRRHERLRARRPALPPRQGRTTGTTSTAPERAGPCPRCPRRRGRCDVRPPPRPRARAPSASVPDRPARWPPYGGGRCPRARPAGRARAIRRECRHDRLDARRSRPSGERGRARARAGTSSRHISARALRSAARHSNHADRQRARPPSRRRAALPPGGAAIARRVERRPSSRIARRCSPVARGPCTAIARAPGARCR